MGRFFEEMPLRHKLTVMLSVFVLGFVWLVQNQVSGSLERRTEGDQLLAIADLSVKTNAVVHELQKERSLATAYIASDGSQFAMDLAQQQSVTDRRLADFTALRDAADSDGYSHVLDGTLAAISARLELLDETRSAISAGRMSAGDELEYYSLLNTAFLDAVAALPQLSTDGAINNSSLAYMALLQSKERAAREGAMTAAALVADSLSAADYDELQALIAAQPVFIETFASLASAEHVASYVETMDAHTVDETERMRADIAANPLLSNFGIDADYWLRTQAERLDLYREVDSKVSNDLRSQISNKRHDAAAGVRATVLISAAVLIYSIVFAIAMGRTILSQLGADPQHLRSIVDAIANDDLYKDPEAESTATGVYADVLHMQRKLRERIKADRDALAENSRIRQALNNVDGNVMITDEERNIVYINDAATLLFQDAQPDIRKDIPEFNASTLMGQSIDLFRSGRPASSGFLEELLAAHCAEINLGGRTLKVVVNPVYAESGDVLGSVVEWTDRTQEVAMENEVNQVVGRALVGDLSHRIDMTGKEGFFSLLSGNINKLVDVAERVINDTLRVLGAMAHGRLDERIESNYEGSFEQLKRDANATVCKLTEVVGGILESAASVKTGVEEISQGNIHLSQRTEEQAASLEETAASMEEMTTTVRQNADNAEKANQLARVARQHAEKGGSVVSQAVLAMREINDSSRKIADIIGVIDEIAFQTNLLALNASVEAARAGEQGRGFAVVASEVRNLAGRSATAAREIKDLIEDSGGKVEEGSRLVNESGSTLEEIVNGVREVTDIVSDIATASQEQSIGIEEVSKSILQMDDLTQQNAALVEEAAAASESLGDQAADLNRMMAFFAASKTAAARTESRKQPTFERRKKDRPWVTPAANDTGAPAPALSAAVNDVTQDWDDAEWEEF